MLPLRLRSSLGRASLVLALGATACGESSGSPPGSPSSTTTAATTSATGAGAQAGAAAAAYLAQLASAEQARRADYLAFAAQGGGYYAQIARLSHGAGPVDRSPLDAAMDFMDARKDTADFKANALVRLLALHGSHPGLPSDVRDRIERTLLGFKYWVDEPGRDEMIFWSENHQLIFSAAEYVLGSLYPQAVFTNDGRSGQAHAASARPRILAWLDHRLRFGFAEWYSPVYYSHDIAPLLNLVDFAPDAEVRTRAAMVLDLLVFDLARLSHAGSFGVTSGRISQPKYAFAGRNQGVRDTIEILFGTRGGFVDRGATAATCLATSSYQVPHALLAVGADAPTRLIDRARMGLDLADGPAEGIGFSSLDDGLFWWGSGAMLAPESIALTRRMIGAWDLWHYPYFAPFARTRFVPDALLPTVARTFSPLAASPILGEVNSYTFRNQGAMLSSAQSYRPGETGAQHLAWIATLDLDACVWTTAPGNALGSSLGAMGEWNGSASLPRVVQVEDVAVVLYNPPLVTQVLFPPHTHAWFPKAAFDEVRTQGEWTFGRKGTGYVALRSARSTYWTHAGQYADQELRAPGFRNAWICQVGCAQEDGAFADFVAAVSQANVTVTGARDEPSSRPLSVRYDAPGLGVLEVAWEGTPTHDGRPVPIDGYPRFDSPYAQQAFGDPVLEVRCAGALLRHDRLAGTRAGDGL